MKNNRIILNRVQNGVFKEFWLSPNMLGGASLWFTKDADVRWVNAYGHELGEFSSPGVGKIIGD